MTELESLALSALKEGKCLKFKYDGFVRTVEVHAVGLSAKGNLVMRAYQTSGKSQSDTNGWKKFILSNCSSMRLTKTPSKAPRSGYKMGDSWMVKISGEIEI